MNSRGALKICIKPWVLSRGDWCRIKLVWQGENVGGQKKILYVDSICASVFRAIERDHFVPICTIHSVFSDRLLITQRSDLDHTHPLVPLPCLECIWSMERRNSTVAATLHLTSPHSLGISWSLLNISTNQSIHQNLYRLWRSRLPGKRTLCFPIYWCQLLYPFSEGRKGAELGETGKVLPIVGTYR